MSKPINIRSLLQAKKTLKTETFEKITAHHNIKLKEKEINNIDTLISEINAKNNNPAITDKFYISYTIPQIGKEFDLLRFGKEKIINIEIKNEPTQTIEKQLLRNKYYLNFTNKDVSYFTFIATTKQLFTLNNNNTLEECKIEALIATLNQHTPHDYESLENLFNPSDYLVSPFNATKKFLNSEYFLTNQQEKIKTEIINSLDESKTPTFISLTGSAGTGKTLLTYDIAKQLIDNKKNPLIIHCGNLNEGQAHLVNAGWEILPIKDHLKTNQNNYDLVIIDESQRLKKSQLDRIIESTNKNNGLCIFSHDKLQTLSAEEKHRDISIKIESIPNIIKYELSEKVRTNKEIANFIKMLFNNKKNIPSNSKGNIEINYFDNNDDAKKYLDSLDKEKFEVLRFTPSQYKLEHHEKYSSSSNKTSHQVIGQEFDGVAIAIDTNFSYNTNGDLIYIGQTYYHPEKMLFQNITRCRKKLNLVIINNETLLHRCLSVLNQAA